MNCHLVGILAALLTFCAGLASNILVNNVAYAIIEQGEKASGFVTATFLWRTPQLTPPHVGSCGLVVTVANGHSLLLNSRKLGSLQDPGALLDRLRAVFFMRTEMRVYREGMETAYEVAEDDRIEKTVFVKVDGTMPYREVVDLVRRLREVGANPIGLVDTGPVSGDARRQVLSDCSYAGSLSFFSTLPGP